MISNKFVLSILLWFVLTFSYGQDKKVIVDYFGADSLVQIFHENGQLFYQVPYKNGKQSGWYEQFHKNGLPWTKYYVLDGKIVDGYNVALRDNGLIYQKGFYKDGHQVGEWFSYTTEGEPFKIYFYDNEGNWIKLKVWNPEKKIWEKSKLY